MNIPPAELNRKTFLANPLVVELVVCQREFQPDLETQAQLIAESGLPEEIKKVFGVYLAGSRLPCGDGQIYWETNGYILLFLTSDGLIVPPPFVGSVINAYRSDWIKTLNESFEPFFKAVKENFQCVKCIEQPNITNELSRLLFRERIESLEKVIANSNKNSEDKTRLDLNQLLSV